MWTCKTINIAHENSKKCNNIEKPLYIYIWKPKKNLKIKQISCKILKKNDVHIQYTWMFTLLTIYIYTYLIYATEKKVNVTGGMHSIFDT